MTRKPAAAAAGVEQHQHQHQRGAGGGALKRGPWAPEEDELLSRAVARDGEGRWRTLPRRAGLARCGKSCRLRWLNYLRPGIKREPIAADEEDLILRLHRLLGNRWSLIAGRLPGRTDNEIKNYWNSHLAKKLVARGIDPRTHMPLAAGAAGASRRDEEAAGDDKKPLPPPVLEPSPVPPLPPPELEPSPVAPPPPAQPSSSPAAGAGCEDGGSDFAAATVGLGAEGFQGFADEQLLFPRDAAAGGGFDMVDDDGTFSSFLDSLINEDRLVGCFGDHERADDGNDQGGAS